MFDLPFAEVWAVDFEFIAPPGEQPTPVCMVAHELASNRLLRLWADELGPEPPFRTDADVLFVAFFASAEWSCFLRLGWPLPARIIDLFAEFRVETNGLMLPAGHGLLGALSHHGLAAITKEEKQAKLDKAATARGLVLEQGSNKQWRLVDATTGTLVAADWRTPTGFGLTLDEIETTLAALD